MARIATNTNSSTTKPRALFIGVGIMVLIIGILAGVYLVRSRITTENQASEEFTHQITCSVGEMPEGRVCTVSVEGSPDSPQTVSPEGIGHPDYLFKVKMETEGQEFLCKLDCGIEACMPTDAASCGGLPQPSSSPTPSPSPSPTPTPAGACGTPCGESIAECPSNPNDPEKDFYCNEDGFCDNDIVCAKPSATPTVTVSPSPTPTPTPTGPTPTLPPGVTPSPTVTPKPTATVAPTPTTEIVCVPPNPAPNVALSCTTGTCSWGSVSGSDKYKVTVVDMTTDKKIAGYDPYKDVTGTRIEFDTVAGHSYRCTVEAVNSCGAKQASSAYRDSEVCSTSQTSVVSPQPTDIIVVNNQPTPAVPTPTLPPGTTPSSTPVPTLPVAGQINFSLWALVGISAIVFGLIAFR